MISKDEVLKIARLARLELSEKEILQMQKDLSEILDYFELLKSAPAQNPPSADIEAGKASKDSSLRRDEAVLLCDKRDEIIAAAPDKKDGYIRVKAIF